MKKNSHHNGSAEGAALNHCRTFVKRVKHLVPKGYVEPALIRAFNEEGFFTETGGVFRLVEIVKEKPPSYEETLKFWYDNHPPQENTE